MKIIYSANIPVDTSNEYLWLDALPDDAGLCKRICAKLNERLAHYENGMYFRAVPDTHILYKWEP